MAQGCARTMPKPRRGVPPKQATAHFGRLGRRSAWLKQATKMSRSAEPHSPLPLWSAATGFHPPVMHMHQVGDKRVEVMAPKRRLELHSITNLTR